MLKLIILAGLLYGVYFFFFKKTNVLNQNKKKDIKKDSETMVECQKCGTFISANEALISNGKYFCSKECVDAYNRT